MIRQRKTGFMPGVIGCFISVMLIVSFFLNMFFGSVAEVVSFNSILVLLILCLSIHLVRKTSALFFDHVWKSIPLLILWLIPVANLVFSACQFIWNSNAFWQSPVFFAILVLFSLPAFCCYYFTVICLFFNRHKSILVSTVILDAVGLCYCPLSLIYRIFYSSSTGFSIELPDILEILILDSRWFSFVIYILSFVSFIICAKLFNTSLRTDE